MDVKFPLKIDNGKLSLTDNRTVNSVRHFLATNRGERDLQPEFGIDPRILFNVNSDALFSEMIRLELNQLLTGDRAQVEIIGFGSRLVKVKITIAETTLETVINGQTSL